MRKVAPNKKGRKKNLPKNVCFAKKMSSHFFLGGEKGRKQTFKKIACNGKIYNIVPKTLELIDWIGLGANAVKMKNVVV